jgi:hypothetical protein
MKNFSSFLQDNSGGLSATRLAFLLWAVGVLGMWIYSSIQQGKLAPIDGTVVTVLGILMTGKTVQRFGEQTDSSSDDATAQHDKAQKSLSVIPPHQPPVTS